MILKFSIPAAVSLLITAIYNIVDRIFVGNFNGTSALAGLSICFPLSYMMMAFGLTCSAGGSSLFSLFAGKQEQENQNLSFGNALILVIIFVAAMHWGVTGAAWATVIGQTFSALFGLYLVLKGYTKIEIKKDTFQFHFGISKKIILCSLRNYK